MAKTVECPRVGDVVYYYSPGNVSSPAMGHVTESFGPDIVSLSVWETGMYRVKTSVHRRDCDILKESPVILHTRGCWDYRDPPEVRQAMRDLLEMAMSKKPSKA